METLIDSLNSVSLETSVASGETVKSSCEAARPSENDLNEMQQKAFDLLCKGKNVFITGSAGTGKSYVLERYYHHATKVHGEDNVFKTSSTGVSALLINGKTIHSWAGIMLGEGTVSDLIYKMTPVAKLRWIKVKVLFIDEISMINPELFDKLESIARIIKKNHKPFGGIQLVITGDFFQLPVVKCDLFCFESVKWNDVVDHTISLVEIVRQRDPVFQELLNQVRYGYISDSNSELLKSRVNAELKNEHGIEPTILYSKNVDVDSTNKKRLQKLIDSGNALHTYNATFTKRNLGLKPTEYARLFEQFQQNETNIPNKILLAKGAQVIFKKNIDDNVANGTRAVVVDFTKTPEFEFLLPVVRLLNGQIRIVYPFEFEYQVKREFRFTKLQIPLKLAWASTIHACQGSTLDYVKADIGENIFTYAQVYVVLSRVRTLEGLTLINYDPNSIVAHPSVLAKYKPSD